MGKNGEFVLNVSNLTTCRKLIRTYTTHVQKNTSLYIFAIHLFIYTFCIPFLALVEVVVMKITAFFTWGGAYDVSYLYSPERQWRMKEQQSKSETWHEYDKEMEQNNAVDVSENRKRKQVRCRKIEKLCLHVVMKPYLTYDSRPESLQTLEDVSSLCFPSSAIFAFLCIRLLAGRWLVDKIRRLSLTSGCYRMTSAFQCWVSISCFCHPSLNFIFF